MSAKNTIVDGDKVFLIDFGCAHVGIVPFDEFISLEKSTEREFAVFREAYGMSDETFKQNERIFRILSMLSAFDKLRWAIDNHVDTAYYLAQAKENFENFNISGESISC